MATFDITGKVIDQVEGGIAVPFATVVPVGADGKIIANLGAITDMDGNFKLKIPMMSLPNPAMPSVPIIVPVASKFRVSFRAPPFEAPTLQNPTSGLLRSCETPL